MVEFLSLLNRLGKKTRQRRLHVVAEFGRFLEWLVSFGSMRR